MANHKGLQSIIKALEQREASIKALHRIGYANHQYKHVLGVYNMLWKENTMTFKKYKQPFDEAPQQTDYTRLFGHYLTDKHLVVTEQFKEYLTHMQNGIDNLFKK